MRRLALALLMVLAMPPLAAARDYGHADRGGYGRAAPVFRGGPYGGRGGGPVRGWAPGRGPPGYYAPPAAYGYRNPGPGAFAPGGGRWRRGQRLPQGYRGELLGDYARYHLRRPPPGYYWYRNGDNFVLAALASGLIFEVISAEGY